MVKGYSIPLSPLGQANLAGDPPWHYSSEILAAEFWVNRQAAQATLPPNVIADGDDAVRAVIMYLDWQFTASNEEMLDPARYQYRETFILLDAHWHDLAITYCPYIYVDNDAALMRGMVQGYPKKLGSVFQTRSFAAPSPAAAPMKEGTKFGASLSAHGERLADIRVTLRDAIADPTTVFNRPTVMRRYFPRLEAGAHHRPAVDQLTLSLTDNLHLVDQDQQQGKDAFILKLSPGAKDPQADRKFRDVGEFQRTIVAHWAKLKLETLPGPAGWLPQAEWAPLRVFRKELAVKTTNAQDGGRGAQRIYIDDYLVLSKGNECFQVESWTVRDDHVAFRTQSEGIIKSVHFGKSDAQPKGRPSAVPVPPLTTPN